MITKSTMTVIWERPALDGGSDIDGYYLEKREKKSLQWFKVGLMDLQLILLLWKKTSGWMLNVSVQVVKGTIRDTRQKVSNLQENNEYQFRVCAVNKAGAGNYSEASELYRAYDPIGTPSAHACRHTWTGPFYFRSHFSVCAAGKRLSSCPS